MHRIHTCERSSTISRGRLLQSIHTAQDPEACCFAVIVELWESLSTRPCRWCTNVTHARTVIIGIAQMQATALRSNANPTTTHRAAPLLPGCAGAASAPSVISAADEHAAWLNIIKHNLSDAIKPQEHTNTALLNLHSRRYKSQLPGTCWVFVTVSKVRCIGCYCVASVGNAVLVMPCKEQLQSTV